MHPSVFIRYIVWFATQIDIRLTTNRLVKFIYLADLYNARVNRGQTLTGFPWRFIYYGPYCSEVMQCVDQMVKDGLICKESYESHFAEDKKYNIFSCQDESAEKLEDGFNIGVLGQIQKAIRKFGDDTPMLLDHVYFDTEPMADAKKGGLLDFSKAVEPGPIKKVKLKKLSSEKIKLARKKIKQLGEELKADRERLSQDDRETEKYKDEAYYKFIKAIDGEELQVGLKGIAGIQIPK